MVFSIAFFGSFTILFLFSFLSWLPLLLQFPPDILSFIVYIGNIGISSIGFGALAIFGVLLASNLLLSKWNVVHIPLYDETNSRDSVDHGRIMGEDEDQNGDNSS